MVKSFAVCLLACAATALDSACESKGDAMSALQHSKQNTKLGQVEFSISTRLAQVSEQASNGASQVCIAVAKGEVAPVAGLFFPENGGEYRVVHGDTSSGPGRFCVESGVVSMLQRSFGLSNAAEFEQALVAKKKGTEGATNSKEKSDSSSPSSTPQTTKVPDKRTPKPLAKVVISEVADKGTTGDCEGEDWLELHNFGESEIDLGGFRISETGSSMFTFSEGTKILAGEYLGLCTVRHACTVLCIVHSFPANCHVDVEECKEKTNKPQFKIGADDTLTLIDDDGIVLSTTTLAHGGAEDQTWALKADGTYAYTTTATFREENVFTDPPVTVEISEVAYQGSSGRCDDADWVELHNHGASEVSLEGYMLYDSKGRDDEDAFTFPVGSKIGPNEYLALCTKADGTPQFGIGKDDSVTLADSDGVIVSSTTLTGSDPAETTWARRADGFWSFSTTATFGAENIIEYPSHQCGAEGGDGRPMGCTLDPFVTCKFGYDLDEYGCKLCRCKASV